jgi:hypothetical protein
MDHMTDNETPQPVTASPAPAGRRLIVEGAVFIAAALLVKGVIMGTPFATGPLRHWYVQTLLVAAAVGLFWGGEWLIRRGYNRRAQR